MKLKRIFLFLLALTLVLTFTACGDTPPEECTAHVDADENGKCDVCDAVVEPEDKPEDKPQGNTESLTLIEDGKAKFQIVTSNKLTTSANLKKTLDTLKKALKELDIEVDFVTESDKNAKDCEVIIGAPTTRGEAYEYDEHTLGYDGYAVKLVEGKVLILGGSEAALLEAIDVFTEDFLGIDSRTKELDTVVIKSTQSIEEIQDDYRITALKLNGADMKGYTIAANTENKSVKTTVEYMQNLFYTKTGYWFDIVAPDKADKSIIITVKENTYEGNGFSIDIVDDDIVIETEFPNRLEKNVSNYLATNVTVKQGEIDFTQKTHKFTTDVRTVYYSEFVTADDKKEPDDFKLMQRTHEYANQWGHSVKADKGAEYTISKGRHNDYIVIKTNTSWKGATITVDDSALLPENRNGYTTNIFVIETDFDDIKFDADKIPISTLKTDATNIGFAPGFKAMVKLSNSNVKHYIRYGANQDNGQSQQDAVLVDADGTILEDTGVLFDYDAITSLSYRSVEDRPVELEGCEFLTVHNRAPSEYTYYSRGIYIERSNTWVHGFDHDYIDEGDTGAPYSGFLVAQNCYNVTISDCDLDEPKSFKTIGSGGVPVGMGSYAFTGKWLIDITWKDLTMKTFYSDEPGMEKYAANGGQMGSNYCKNILFENNQLTSFDSHCGAKNITVRNCELEHINCIGGGDVLIEDTVVFVQYKGSAIVLREDYGAIWMGTVTFRNVELRSYSKTEGIALIHTPFIAGHDFGYKTGMPHTVIVDNVWATADNGSTIPYIALATKDLSASGFDVRKDTINPYGITENFIIESNPKGTVFNLFKNSVSYKNIKVTDKTGTTGIK